MKAVVSGMIAAYPVGGVVWDYGQYALGLERLGFEVFYLEDTGEPSYDPARRVYDADCSYGLAFLTRSLAELSPDFGRRWHFRGPDGVTTGMGAAEFQKVIAAADLFLNVSGSCLLREEYLANPRKVLIDTDPGRNHFVNYPREDAGDGWQGTRGFRGTTTSSPTPSGSGSRTALCPTSPGLPEWHPDPRPPVLLDHRTEPPASGGRA